MDRAGKRATGSMLGMVKVTIEDNDELSASVTVPEAVAEGETARFTVTLGGGTSTADVVVTYSVGGTAKGQGLHGSQATGSRSRQDSLRERSRFRPTLTMRSSRTRRWW